MTKRSAAAASRAAPVTLLGDIRVVSRKRRGGACCWGTGASIAPYIRTGILHV